MNQILIQIYLFHKYFRFIDVSSFSITKIYLFFYLTFKGGGNIGSIAILNKFSITEGMILFNREHDVSKQGFVLTSISQGWRF